MKHVSFQIVNQSFCRSQPMNLNQLVISIMNNQEKIHASILLVYSPVSTGPRVPCLGNGAICSRLILATSINNMKTILYRYVKGVLWFRWSLSENLMSVILDGANLTFKTYHQVLFREILYVFQMISDIWKVEIFCFLKYMFIIFYVHTWFACTDVCVPDNVFLMPMEVSEECCIPCIWYYG